MKFIIISIIILLFILFLYSACKLAKREDQWAEKQYYEYIKSKNKDNNKTNNEGE